MTPHPSTSTQRPKAAKRYFEEGAAFMDIAGTAATRASAGGAEAKRPVETKRERTEVVVIGAGQCGLSVGYHLARRGIPFVILDANERIGDTWRRRWDSLRLFTPAGYDGLDGMRFPDGKHAFPTKDEMADFLEAYAGRFDLPVRSGVRVDRMSRRDGRYLVSAGDRQFEAANVVVAMGTFQRPKRPSFAGDLDPGIVQLHSADYRNPGQLQDGDVLIVGAGNSGSEVARELATRGHKVYMSGRDTGHIPFRIEGFLGRNLLVHLTIGVVFYHLLTTSTPLGRKVRPKVLGAGRTADPGQAEGPRRPRCRTGPADRRRRRRQAAPRRRPRPRRQQRGLVHGLRAGLLVDRPAGLRQQPRTHPPARRRGGRAGALFRRPRISLFDGLRHGPGRRP